MSSKNHTELNHLGMLLNSNIQSQLNHLLIHLLIYSVREYLSRQTGYEHIVEEMDKIIASNDPTKVFIITFLRTNSLTHSLIKKE